MSTLQEVIAKRQELQKTDPNATNVTARQALQPTVAPTPAPVSPTTAPVQTPTVQWVDWATFVQAPVDQITGLTKVEPVQPVATAPVQNVSQTAPVQPVTAEVKPPVTPKATVASKTEPTVNYNTSVGREADVQTNLDSFVASGMDAEKLKTASGYETADPAKKAMIEATIAKIGQPMDSNSVYNAIATNAPLNPTIKNTPEYKSAQYTYSKVQQFRSMSPQQLVTAISSGALLPWTTEYNKLIQDPTMAQKVVDASIYTKQVDLEKAYKAKITELIPQNNKVAQFFSDGIISQDEIDQMTNTADVVAQAKVWQTKQQALNAEVLAEENEIAQVKKDFAGSPFLASMIADIRQWHSAQKTFLQNEVSIATWTLTELKAVGLQTLNTNLGEYQKYRDAQIEVDKTRAKDALDIQKTQAEFDQEIQQKAQLAKDPQTAIQTMVDEYKKLWIPFTWSVQSIIADYNQNGNGDLASYLTELQKTIQSKPEYQKYQTIQKGQLSETEKLSLSNQYDIKKLAINNGYDLNKLSLQYNLKNVQDITASKIDLQSKWFTSNQADAIIRNSTGNWKGASGETLLSATDGTIIPTRLSETTNKNGGKECAEFVNDITGTGLGSTWDSKKNKIDSSITIPKVWNTAIWIPDPSNKNFAKYWHAGIVTGSDGINVTIKSSNLNWDGSISTITVPISQIQQTGWFANTAIKWTNSNNQWNSAIAEQVIASWSFTKTQADAIRNSIKNWENPEAVIKNQAKNLMTAADKSNTQWIEQALWQMNSLQSALTSFYNAGWDTNLLKWKYEEVLNNLGEVSDPKLVTLATQIQRSLQSYRKNITGTAYGIQEWQDIEKVFPGIKKWKILNDAITEGNIKSMQSDIDNAYISVLYWAYDKIKSPVSNAKSSVSMANNPTTVLSWSNWVDYSNYFVKPL